MLGSDQIAEQRRDSVPDSMTVRLHPYRIRVVDVLVDVPERLEVLVTDLRSVVRCPFCGFKTNQVHEIRRAKVKDLPRGDQRVTLVWLRRRCACLRRASHGEPPGDREQDDHAPGAGHRHGRSPPHQRRDRRGGTGSAGTR